MHNLDRQLAILLHVQPVAYRFGAILLAAHRLASIRSRAACTTALSVQLATLSAMSMI